MVQIGFHLSNHNHSIGSVDNSSKRNGMSRNFEIKTQFTDLIFGYEKRRTFFWKPPVFGNWIIGWAKAYQITAILNFILTSSSTSHVRIGHRISYHSKCIKQVDWICNFSSFQCGVWSNSSPQYSKAENSSFLACFLFYFVFA